MEEGGESSCSNTFSAFTIRIYSYISNSNKNSSAIQILHEQILDGIFGFNCKEYCKIKITY